MLLTLVSLAFGGGGGGGAFPPPPQDKDDMRPAWIAAPLLSYDSTLLFGYGGFGGVIFPSPDPEQPYRLRISGQFYKTTGGYANHFFRFEIPGLLGTQWRWRSDIRYVDWSQAPYYGIGNNTPISKGQPEEYYEYKKTGVRFRQDLRYPLWGDWEAFGTWSFRNEHVRVPEDTLLAQDLEDGVAVGADGGRYSYVALGMLRDTRDNEIDPSRGAFLNASGRVSHPYVLSEYSVVGFNVSASAFFPLHERVVSASNLSVDLRFGDEPFWNLAYVGGLGRGTIGGRWAFRGLPEERLRGNHSAWVQQELRVHVWQGEIFNNDMDFMVVPFTDIGRVWDPGEIDDWYHLHATFGAGLRVDVRELAVLRADVGLGWEKYDTGSELGVELYVLADHPF